jgi:DNA-binding transcriptional LysR family regulator
MYIDSFKVFCDLVDSRSFSKAAEKNKITQSAVSQQIRSLEERFGVVLLERTRRQVSVTPEGTAFLEACTKIIEVWNEFENRLGVMKNHLSGEVRVGAIYSIGLYELPARLKRFHADYPEVSVRVQYGTVDQVSDWVEDGSVDIGLIAFQSKRKHLIYEEFGEDELVVVTAPENPISKSASVSLSALAGHRFVALDPECPTRKLVERQLRDADVKVNIIGEFDSVETAKRVVRIENAVSVLPMHSVRDEVAAGTLVELRIKGTPLKRPLGTIMSRSRPRPPGLKELVQTLKK